MKKDILLLSEQLNIIENDLSSNIKRVFEVYDTFNADKIKNMIADDNFDFYNTPKLDIGTIIGTIVDKNVELYKIIEQIPVYQSGFGGGKFIAGYTFKLHKIDINDFSIDESHTYSSKNMKYGMVAKNMNDLYKGVYTSYDNDQYEKWTTKNITAYKIPGKESIIKTADEVKRLFFSETPFAMGITVKEKRWNQFYIFLNYAASLKANKNSKYVKKCDELEERGILSGYLRRGDVSGARGYGLDVGNVVDKEIGDEKTFKTIDDFFKKEFVGLNYVTIFYKK